MNILQFPNKKRDNELHQELTRLHDREDISIEEKHKKELTLIYEALYKNMLNNKE